MKEDLHPGAELEIVGEYTTGIYISHDDLGFNVVRGKGRVWIPHRQVKHVRWRCDKCMTTWNVVKAALAGDVLDGAELFTKKHALCESTFPKLATDVFKVSRQAHDRLIDGMWVMDLVSR